jgi:ACS family sodium-dependent inorganic phosphate cotransporter
MDPRGGPPSYFRSTRFIIILLALGSNACCYADRTNISVAILAMADDMEWDEVAMGHVLSAFFYGYLCTQVSECVCARVSEVVCVCGICC